MKYLHIAFIAAFLLPSATSVDNEFTYSPTSIVNAPTFAPTELGDISDPFLSPFNVTEDCGNGICDEGENCLSCAVDCISGTSGGFECGNSVCEDGETCFTCPQDCMSSEALSGGNEAGDSFCCFGGRRSPDLTNGASCNDLRCRPPGIQCNGEQSPFVTYCCGDGVCAGEETALNCGIDNCVESCGDGFCDESIGENAQTCPSDCACNLDGRCDSWETVETCPLDCTCGNYVCDVDLGENVANCMTDCACNANYDCEPWEDAEHCPRDCGQRAEWGQGDGHDANDGQDGMDQQYDGSYGGFGDVNSRSAGSTSSNSVCFDNNEQCASNDDCCSSACDTNLAEGPICVG